MPGSTNIGSKATPSALNKASRTTLRGTVSTPSSRAQGIQPIPSRAAHPGSRAGLKDAKSVHLNMNGTGYLNPAHQTARLKNRTQQIDTSIAQRFNNQKITSRTFDNRLTSSKSNSISLMNKRIPR